MDAPDTSSVNFLDIACLLKINPDTTLEKLGGLINASVFDAANIAGTLKQKNLIEFGAEFPGPTGMQLTDVAKNLLNELNARSTEPIDVLDVEILKQLSGGKRMPIELQNTLNLLPRDLAFRLYKLYKQNFISYNLKNGNVELMLTEQGFLKANESAKPAQQANAAPSIGQAANVQAQVQAPSTASQQQAQVAQAQAQAQQENQQQIQEIAQEMQKPKGAKMKYVAVLIVVIVLAIAVLAAKHIL